MILIIKSSSLSQINFVSKTTNSQQYFLAMHSFYCIVFPMWSLTYEIMTPEILTFKFKIFIAFEHVILCGRMESPDATK